jgi:hypothetical protein
MVQNFSRNLHIFPVNKKKKALTTPAIAASGQEKSDEWSSS